MCTSIIAAYVEHCTVPYDESTDQLSHNICIWDFITFLKALINTKLFCHP